MVMVNRFHCDRKLLTELLNGVLPEARQASVAAHLDACPSCCATLEKMAAEDSWWTAAERHLSDPSWSGADEQTASIKPRLSHVAAQDLLQTANLDFLQPATSPEYLGRLGRYDILDVVGQGGMGIVLKGYEANLNRWVAIKVLAPHVSGNGTARQRFAREARAAAAVVHPHVIAIYGVETDAQLPYLVMPFVDGHSVEQRIRQDGPLELIDVVRVAQQIAAGLAAAHVQGLVHRDIKPGNILLEYKLDRVLITDFGLARAVDDIQLTTSGWIAGTPPYMSPEQARGEAVDHRSDLFSLGSVMYAMCTGQAPFHASNSVAVLRKVCDQQPPDIRHLNPAIPPWLVQLIRRLHEKSPARRIQTAQEVAQLLEQCLAHLQQPLQVKLPNELRGGGRWPIWVGLPLGALLLGGTLWALMWAANDELPASRAPIAPAQVPEMAERVVEQHAEEVELDSAGPVDVSWPGKVESELLEIELGLQDLEWQLLP